MAKSSIIIYHNCVYVHTIKFLIHEAYKSINGRGRQLLWQCLAVFVLFSTRSIPEMMLLYFSVVPLVLSVYSPGRLPRHHETISKDILQCLRFCHHFALLGDFFLHSGPAGDGRAVPVARGVRMYCNRPVHAFPRDHYCNFQNVTLPF